MKPTFESVKSNIDDVQYFFYEKSTVCFMKATCGHVFVGESHCYDINDYSIDEGKNWAYKNAFDKLFDAECYLSRNFEKFIESLGANTEIPEPISGGIIL